jgi:hypothetical protein
MRRVFYVTKDIDILSINDDSMRADCCSNQSSGVILRFENMSLYFKILSATQETNRIVFLKKDCMRNFRKKTNQFLINIILFRVIICVLLDEFK